MSNTQIIQRGTRIYCILAHAGEGVVTAAEADPVDGQEFVLGARGFVRAPEPADGRQRYDVVFRSGHFSRGVPDSIVRGVQWRILEGEADEEEIAALLAAHEQYRAETEAALERQRIAFEAERDLLRTDPAYQHLTQGDDASSGLLAGKNIRAILKRKFPGTKFSVQKRSWGSVSIHWQDGPTDAQVNDLVGQFQSGSFDSSEDLYVNAKSPWNVVFGGARYVSLTREVSSTLITHAIAAVMVDLGDIGIGVPTAEDFFAGRLWDVETPGANNLEALIRRHAAGLAG
jgi:hypothetical protein